MNKLKLEHLAPYLPYELKVTFEGDEYTHIVVGLNIASSRGVELISPFGHFGTARVEDCIPILRPLSDLTKEINHKGERFVPMVELYKIARGRFKDSIVKQWSVMSTTSIIVEKEGNNDFIFSLFKSDSDVRIEDSYFFQLHSTNSPKLLNIQCWNILFQKLLEWHFDIFRLLDKKLAIDINTLNENND